MRFAQIFELIPNGEGAERVMRRDRLRAYPRGGIQDISNFQSPYPFKTIANYVANANQDGLITIEGGVVCAFND